MPSDYAILSSHRDVLGEGPWWNWLDQTMYWVDSGAEQVHWATLGDGVVFSTKTPSEPGFVTACRNGDFVVGCRDGLYRTDSLLEPQWDCVWRGDWDTSVHRINDGKTDRRGRLWFGTYQEPESAATAELYRRYDGHTDGVLGEITVSNGLGWSPDDRTMYYTDSATRTIRAFDYDCSTGDIGNGRVFANDSRRCEPDGLTVDSHGCVWSAKWDGGMVVRYTPDGRIDEEVKLPVSRPTSCMFVGPQLRTLAITTAAQPAGRNEPLAGAVFLIDVGAQGLRETPAVV